MVYVTGQTNQHQSKKPDVDTYVAARFPTNESMVEAFNSNPIAYIKDRTRILS